MKTKKLIIVGAGGFARELAWLVQDINSEYPEWEILGFIDEDATKAGQLVNRYPILGDFSWFENNHKDVHVAFAIGNPVVRKRLVEKFKSAAEAPFPNLLHPSVKCSKDILMGYGNILCANTVLTTNITLGSFNIVNLNCTIGHDVVISDFCTIAPASNISGRVLLYDGCELGTNTCIIPGKSIGRWSVTGAGSVVTKDLPSHCTAVGAPAKPIKYHCEEGNLQ